MAATDAERYAGAYDPRALWRKIRRYGRVAGRQLVEKALLLYFVLRDPATPAWARATVLAALGYFIAPIDALPDFLPGIGFSDDLLTLTLAAVTVASSVTPAMRRRARELVDRIFGRGVPEGPVIEVEAELLDSSAGRS